jgi:hypothetical protein
MNILSEMVCSQGAEHFEMMLPWYRAEFNVRARAYVKSIVL